MKFVNVALTGLSTFFSVAFFATDKAHADVPPTFVTEAETVWGTLTAPKTTGSFSVTAGDILVAAMAVESYDSTLSPTLGMSSSPSQTWTQQQIVQVNNYCWLSIWTATASSSGSMTVTFNNSYGSWRFGGNVLVFRNSSGVGASTKTNVSGAAPSVSLTTTRPNSAVVVFSADWNAVDGATRTWRTNAGAFTEQTYSFTSGAYTVYGGYHANSGAAASYAVGLSAPGAQKYSIVALEVMGRPKVKHRVLNF